MLTLEPVAHIHSDFPTKFGIPRQSGLVEELEALVVFEPSWRDDNALRGIEGFSHLWLIWEFSQSPRGSWSPTVRPPRLGGNRRVGVFASRSPFRPNPLGLSCVRLLGLEKLPGQGTALRVGGADLLDGTLIYDIKPYQPLSDSHPDARGGFATAVAAHHLTVRFPPELAARVPAAKLPALTALLAGPPPRLPDGPGTGLRFRICGAGDQVPGAGRGTHRGGSLPLERTAAALKTARKAGFHE